MIVKKVLIRVKSNKKENYCFKIYKMSNKHLNMIPMKELQLKTIKTKQTIIL